MNSEEVESLFREGDKTYRPEEPKTRGEKIVRLIEQEFRGFSEEQKSRQQERKEIGDTLRSLRKKLRRARNLRNSRLTEVNNRRASKRASIKKKIEILRMRLQEIDLEEK